jgi:dipeptidyl aminopeptidase/acylaminoacyl peptidase
MPTSAPYGSWSSPITALAVAGGEHPVGSPRPVGDELWWHELRPTEGGRISIRRRTPDGAVQDVLPAPWNARTRVHEYGGGAWTVTDAGVAVFAEYTDQRLYRLDAPGGTPVPLTPEPAEPGAVRFAELTLFPGRDEVLCVRETHAGATITRDLAAVPLDGSAAADPDLIRSIVSGSHFLAAARVSPDGTRIAWIAWEHPQMPWDGTELRVGALDEHGVCPTWWTLLGSTTESVLQPEWDGNDELFALSDRTGFWNLYRVAADGGEPQPLCPLDADFAGPLWQLGAGWFRVLDDGRLLTVRTLGTDTLAVLDPQSGVLTDLDLGDHTSVGVGRVVGDRAFLVTAGAQTPSGARMLDLTTGELTDVRLSVDELPPTEYLPEARVMTFGGVGGRDVHAIVYPPRNPDFVAPDSERPPYVAWVHGGPTSSRQPRLAPSIAYFTSRGIGIVDVNYGGSTGYGREYRERLRGQWGVVDVEDTVAAVQGLAEAGLADGARLAIQGGSAGGWTVLAALTETDAFACGVSYFGVAELIKFAEETHDFESRYLDGLIGPLPEARDLYETRAPVNNVDGLSCPVLLLQGLDDPVVPPSQAERFRDAMVAKSLPHAYRVYAGESHGFRKVETIVDATEAELSFYGQILGFEPIGVPVIELWRP